jgi:hypothetical protein
MAAVLACNPGAALSHRSAAALWGIGKELRSSVEVSVRRRCAHRRVGIHARSRPSLPPGDVVLREWIPVTTPVRTLLDLATEIGPGPLERAVNEADKRGVVDPEALRDSLGRYGGEPGVRVLRRLLDKHTFQLSAAQARDQVRDQTHAAAGLIPLRFTHHQVKYEPAYVRGILSKVTNR